jgi:hypothetical protein
VGNEWIRVLHIWEGRREQAPKLYERVTLAVKGRPRERPDRGYLSVSPSGHREGYARSDRGYLSADNGVTAAQSEQPANAGSA